MQCWRVQHVPSTERASLSYVVEAGFAADPAHEMFGSAETNSRSCCSTIVDLVLPTRMQIKQLHFDSVNADFSAANGFVELLRTENVHEAAVLCFGSRGALGAA
jgi:hypothetical protein